MTTKILNAKQNCFCDKNCVAISFIKQRPDILTDYLLHTEIEEYLSFLAKSYASFVRKHIIGVSWNRLPISAIVIDWSNKTNFHANKREKISQSEQHFGSSTSNLPRQHRDRKTVFIEAGTHGCEWIGISTAVCCIKKLVENMECNRNSMRKLRFVIVPLSNPDGYEISHRNPSFRQNFRGVDCNRNYDVNWHDGCDSQDRNTYRGEYPFSEPETRTIRNLLYILGPQLLLVICLHSYAQTIMYSWGYKREMVEGFEHFKQLAETGREAIRNYSGRHYRIGSILKLMKRNITGSLVDFAHDVIKVPFSLCMELPSRNLGFQPRKELIKELALESWVGIREMCESALNLLPKMAAQRLLFSFQITNYTKSVNNFNDELFEMDLHTLCDQIDNATPNES